jgi:hypothetical protein
MKNYLPTLLIAFGIFNVLAFSTLYFVVVPKLDVLYKDLEQVPNLSVVRVLVVAVWILSLAQFAYGLFLRRKFKAEGILKNPYLAVGIILFVVPTGLMFVYGLPLFLLTTIMPIYKLGSSFQ